MKKALFTLSPILSSFKWYRKRIGGVWFKTYDASSDYGLAGDTYNWTQDPVNVSVIKTEEYPPVQRLPTTKKLLFMSLVLNCMVVMFVGVKRFYYSYAPLSKGNGYDLSFYDNWNNMRSSVYGALPVDSTDIVFVGTSLTEGFPVTELYGRHIKNRGVSGNSTLHVLHRIAYIAQGRPRKIFLEIGINDLNFGYGIDSTFDNYLKIINTIKTYSPGTRIYVQSLMPTGMKYGGVMPRIGALNNLLKQYCNNNNFTFIDLYNPLLKGSVIDSGYTGDGIHLNNKGYAIWENIIDKYIVERNQLPIHTGQKIASTINR